MFIAVSNNNEINLEEIVLIIHKENAHRVSLINILREQGINYSHRKLKNILINCDVCSRIDKNNEKTAIFVETDFPGEKMAFDIMEIKQNQRIIVAIDYFSRFAFQNK
ncbi:hypothetical protein DMUE_1489 [Dictyocoela muelleri]|nr:hypothetical protein DMUE_1489 [Dictyocoela muelleri]